MFNFFKNDKEIVDKIPSVDVPIEYMPTIDPKDCVHDWNLFAKTFASPKPDVEFKEIQGTTLERLMFGVTTYLWECIHCGTIRKIETLGTDENPLNELLEKASGGIQYVDYNNRRFAVALVPNEEAKINIR